MENISQLSGFLHGYGSLKLYVQKHCESARPTPYMNKKHRLGYGTVCRVHIIIRFNWIYLYLSHTTQVSTIRNNVLEGSISPRV